MTRVFIYNNQTYDDPDPNLTPEEVRAILADFMGELNTADIVETKDGNNVTYEFKRKVGTKGVCLHSSNTNTNPKTKTKPGP